ncbi:ubinuclein-1-like [Chelonus insularis]|uniref:ubinuclein-1-like n=1 Tax=Chelonus insularis TaxID=460826 RepID=UPI001588AFA3|nr:ubinuclein-1-like [Chelonus insularis]
MELAKPDKIYLEKKKAKELKNLSENVSNGLDPFDDNDDAKLKEVARKFEAKYGPTQMTGKKKKKYDEVDLGAGYDENDPFIDNTDAYDEVVPEGVNTAYGGFYINSGPLEFSVKETNQSESSDDDEEDSPDSKRRERDLDTSDDDDTEEVLNGPITKKLKLDDNCEKKSVYDNGVKRKKKNHDHSHGDNSIRQKNDSMEVDNSFIENQEERKRLQCDASRSKEKKLAKKNITNGTEEKKVESKKCSGKDNNIDDAIESVVNDGKLDDESSRDTIDSGKSRCTAGTSSECEDAEKIDIRLPDNLPEDVKEIITKLKKHAENSKEGKIKFFGTSVNDTLLSLEKKLRATESSTIRSQVYGHLAHFLSCSKITLVSRARKLCLQDAETRVKEPVQRLKTIIDRIVSSQRDEENKKIADEK